MDPVEERRKDIQANIQKNPATITIHRTEKAEDSGGFRKTESELSPIVVRIYQKNSISIKHVSNLSGTKDVSSKWGLLADYQADIKAGPNVLDEFDVNGIGHFQIIDVTPQRVNGQLAGFQADLEKVV